jgi:hypothetical protein
LLGILGALVLAVAGPASAVSVTPQSSTVGEGPQANRPPKASFTWLNNASYILTMRAAAVEHYADIPRYLPGGFGYSQVDLAHDVGGLQGKCESRGAGYYLGEEVEEGVLGAGAAPPDAGDVSGGYKNPTLSRTVTPNLDPSGAPLSEPGVRNYLPPGQVLLPIPHNGAGPNWQATCTKDTQGQAQGFTFDGGGYKVAGSVTSAEVDKSTGVYTGTSRSIIQGLEGAGELDTISSLMQVTNQPNKQPTTTYRISFFNSKAGGTTLAQNGFTVSGTDVPAAQLVEQFNSQSKTVSAALEAIGPLGLELLAPRVGTSTDGNRTEIVAPVIQGTAGSHLRDGTAGQEAGLRFGSTAFTGIYGY